MPRSYRFITLARVLTCCLALALAWPAFASADTARFEIKAEPLSDALKVFAQQAHMQLLYEYTIVRNVRCNAVLGVIEKHEALEDLLRNTGLEAVYTSSSAATIRPISAHALGDAPKPTSTGAVGKGNQRQKDSPYAARLTQPDPGEPVGPSSSKKNSAPSHKVAELQEVIVTGTHIRGAPVSSPVTRITRQEIDRSGYTTVGAVIQSLPDNFANSGPQTAIGAAPTNGTQSLSGAPAPNLYGLGAASTLTLVDGQRLAVDSVTGSVDISLIPLPVIDHIDVLSGGASAIYGSDAVAGVVNIVLYKDFDGSKTSLLGGGTADGGGTERDVNEMLGKTWAGGGAIADYESYIQDPILASQRDYTNTAGTPTTTLPGTSRSSFFVSAHQNLGGAVSIFGTGLYTNRSTRYALSDGPQYPSITYDADVHEFAADGGLNASLASEWSLSVVGDYSEDRTDTTEAMLTTPPYYEPALLNEGQTKSMEATATGPVLAIWSGKVRGAAGLGYRRETYDFSDGSAFAAVGAHRTVKYAYGEIDAPLLTPSNTTWRRELTLDLSGRFEQYSVFGDESVPKIGLVYAPFSTINVRGTWGKAFRAPALYQMYEPTILFYLPEPDPLSATGVSDVLERLGGNPELKPETARTWTIGIDYASKAVEGLRASVTYFDIAYGDRIGQIGDSYDALIDPLDVPFVTRDPPEGVVQSLLNSAAYVASIAGPINPASVPAIIDATDINVASEDVSGGDLDVRYRRALGLGEIEPFINVALIDLRQKLVPGAPESEISGLVFQPPKVRARTGVSWLIQRWTITGIVNYSGSEVNTYQPLYPHVASWTTVDFNLAWQPEKAGVLSGLKLNLAVENAFNRDPSFVQFDEIIPGIHYDSLNANPLGRVIRVGASWLFQ